MAVRRITHDEDAALRHLSRIGIINRPRTGTDQVDLKFWITDKLARNVRRHCFVNNGGGLVDVVTPDDQPFVPRTDTADKAHSDAPYIRSGLHHPIQNRGAMGDIL